MIKAVVTGTRGQLVLSLAEASTRHDIEVVALGRPQLDLAVPEAAADLFAALRPDVVVNAAAYTAVDKAEAEEAAAFAVNAVGAGLIATAAASVGAAVIHLSTDYVFDGRKTAPYIEADPPAPVSAYGRSKLEGERRVAAAAPRHVILRTGWVHSPFGANFVRTMLRLASTRSEIGVVDDQIGTPTYAPHLADAILRIALRAADTQAAQSGIWGILHAAGSGETTWAGLAREVFAVSRRLGGTVATVRSIMTADYPTAATRPANSRLACERLKDSFGIVLPDWRAGVEACVTRLVAEASLPAARMDPKGPTA